MAWTNANFKIFAAGLLIGGKWTGTPIVDLRDLIDAMIVSGLQVNHSMTILDLTEYFKTVRVHVTRFYAVTSVVNMPIRVGVSVSVVNQSVWDGSHIQLNVGSTISMPVSISDSTVVAVA